MSRHKFRAWDKKRNEWYGESCPEILTFKGFAIFGECTLLCTPLGEDLPNLEITQYTGLKDKNGVEIYEGDILDLHSTVNGVNLFEVYYNESQARFSIKYYTNRMPKRSLEYEYSVSDFFKPCEFSGEVDFEVIGNIHQNGDLLSD